MLRHSETLRPRACRLAEVIPIDTKFSSESSPVLSVKRRRDPNIGLDGSQSCGVRSDAFGLAGLLGLLRPYLEMVHTATCITDGFNHLSFSPTSTEHMRYGVKMTECALDREVKVLADEGILRS
jgi:hypothetical protein